MESFNREAQLGKVADLWFRSWLSWGGEHGEGTTVRVLENRLREEPWEIWTAWTDDRLAGFLAIDRENSVLSQLFVEPDLQNRGIGKQMLDFSKHETPSSFSLRTNQENAAARRFYERHGLIEDRLEGGRAYYNWQPNS